MIKYGPKSKIYMVDQGFMPMAIISLILITTLSCKLSDESKERVANGLESNRGEFMAVTRIMSAESKNPKSFGACTATAVSSKTLLTAAHCLVDRETRKIEAAIWVVDENGEKVFAKAQNVKIFPKYDPMQGRIEGNFDIAAVQFDEDIFSHWVSVSDVSGKMGDDIVLVGFGITTVGGIDSGQKRYGTNLIKALSGERDRSGVSHAKDTIILEDGVRDASAADSSGVKRGDKVSNLQGDSGGPIFLNGRLLGVASTIAGSESRVLNGSYISVHYHRDWLKELSFQICGLTLVCDKTPKSTAEVKHQKAMNEGGSSDPKPGLDDIKIFASVTGEAEPTISFNILGDVTSSKLCLGDSKESAKSCKTLLAASEVNGWKQVKINKSRDEEIVYVKLERDSLFSQSFFKLNRVK